MICVVCACVWRFLDVVTHNASYHSGSEGDVVDERGGQSRNPHH